MFEQQIDTPTMNMNYVEVQFQLEVDRFHRELTSGPLIPTNIKVLYFTMGKNSHEIFHLISNPK
jgi:hypothetical protein